MIRSLKKNPFVAVRGRTTGIEPAHGGFTIHCLDPLGYIRPSSLKRIPFSPFIIFLFSLYYFTLLPAEIQILYIKQNVVHKKKKKEKCFDFFLKSNYFEE